MNRLGRFQFAFVLAALLSGPTRAQVPVGSQEGARAEALRKRSLQYPDLVKVVDLAESAPPELAADALLRVAASERNQDRAWKIELLEDSFQMAALARQPNRQKIIGDRVVYRSRAEILSLAFDQRLDRLSLQSRVIRQMLPLDKAKALDMFQRTTWPSLRSRQCRDALVDHVAEYYALVAEIVASAFTAEQRRRGDHVDLLSYQISRIRSPVEVGPAAKLLADSTLTQDELSLLSGRLAASIDRMESDYRSFSASLGTADEALSELARTLVARQASTGGIIATYRRYLIRSLAGKRCADTGDDKFATSVMDSFNRSFASETDPTRAPLVRDEVKPAKVEGQADWDTFIDDAEFQRAWDEYLDLLLGKGHAPLFRSTPLSDEQKNAIEWRTQFDHFLEQIDDLKPAAGEPEYRYFYRKATALTAALRVAPSGPDREKVLRRLVAFLSSSSLQQESVLEWYAQVQRTASSVRALGPEATARFLSELEGSGNPILNLYAVATKVIPDNKH
jgi:hypothetical protein